MEPSEFSLAALIESVRANVSSQTSSARFSLLCMVDAALPDKVTADGSRLADLVQSLVVATSELSRTTEVRLSAHPGRESRSELDITFEFTSKKHESDGACSTPGTVEQRLSSVRKTAQSLGGEIGFQLNDPQGLLLWCRVPVQLAEKQRVSRDRSSSLVQRTEAKFPIRILMAEDNSINQRVGKLILQRAGYKIDLVSDGSEALEAHRKSPYDLILMDCQMPTMDGFEATRQIRSAGVRQPVIIAVTANALLGERERCLAAGMDDYLSKPFQAEQLVSMVEKWAESSLSRANAQPEATK